MWADVEEPFAMECLRMNTSLVWGEGMRSRAFRLVRKRPFLEGRNDSTQEGYIFLKNGYFEVKGLLP